MSGFDRNKRKPTEICCTFCGKYQNEVRKMVAGPMAYICDECVDLCRALLAEEVRDEQIQN